MTKARIEALTDGIFATVMTILVLTLHVPQLNVPEQDLAREVLALWPSILVYVLSFVTLGLYWVGHHAQFHYIKHVDRPFLWINILFLLTVGFIPFSTSLLQDYPWPPTAVRVYGANLIANVSCYSASGCTPPAGEGLSTRTWTRTLLLPLVTGL